MTARVATGLRREVEAVGLISAAHFLSHFYQLALPPLFLPIHEDLGVSFLALGSAVAAYNIATAILQTPVGVLVDRIGARGVLIAGLAVNAGAIAAVGFAESYWAVMAAMIVAGAGNAVFHPADFSLLSSSVDDRRMGRAFSLHSLAGSLGFAAAPVFVLFLASLWDWRTGVFRGIVNPSRDVLLKRLTPAGAVGTVFGFVTTGLSVGMGTAPVLYGWMMDLGRPDAVFWIAAGFTALTIGIVFAARRPVSLPAD